MYADKYVLFTDKKCLLIIYKYILTRSWPSDTIDINYVNVYWVYESIFGALFFAKIFITSMHLNVWAILISRLQS